MIRSAAIRLADRSSVGAARRAAIEQAQRLGWDAVRTGNAAIVATELASNLIKHGREGAMALSGLVACGGGDDMLALVAVDKGPGMNVPRSLEDGFSTAGSAGNGLGAIARLARHLDILSTGDGTVIAAELGGRPQAVPLGLDVGGFCLAKEGQAANGDAWDFHVREGVAAVLVCDGLGHGPDAAAASARAVAAFRESTWRTAAEAIGALDEALRSTRGAAAAVALIDAAAGVLRFCGVGNISARVVAGDGSRHLVSHNGILGYSAVRKTEFEYEWPAGAALVMHSDGVTSRWRPAEIATLWHRRSGLIAGTLYRDFARGSDDVVVSVTRQT